MVVEDCTECKGTGKLIVCKECNGTGNLEFSSDYNDYDVDCNSCDGENIKDEKCGDCEGTGKYKKYSNPIIKKDKIKIMISGMHLEMIQALPNVKIALQDSSEKPIKLKFNEGVGLLMPMERNRE